VTRIRVALDSCLSERFVAVLSSLYGHNGFEFLHIDKLVPAKTKDTSWADVYKRFGGRIVVSGDTKIAYRPHEAVAFIDNGFISFFPDKGWGELRGHEQAAILVHQWPEMARHAAMQNDASCWRFPFSAKRGEIRLLERPMTKLEIPDAVLDATNRRAAKS
jgi:PIN like domain